MVDMKSWLAEATGEPVEEEVFLPENYSTLPYICISDYIEHGGADSANNLVRHQFTIRRFTEDGIRNDEIDSLLDANALKYAYEKMWDSENGFFEEVYYLSSYINERR